VPPRWRGSSSILTSCGGCTARCRLWHSSASDRRESRVRCSPGNRRRCKIFVANLRALPARRGGESSEKALSLRVVWLDVPRRRCSGAGDSATSAVGAHERAIAGQAARLTSHGRGVRVRTTNSLCFYTRARTSGRSISICGALISRSVCARRHTMRLGSNSTRGRRKTEDGRGRPRVMRGWPLCVSGSAATRSLRCLANAHGSQLRANIFPSARSA